MKKNEIAREIQSRKAFLSAEAKSLQEPDDVYVHNPFKEPEYEEE